MSQPEGSFIPSLNVAKSALICLLLTRSIDIIFVTACIKPPHVRNNPEASPSPLPVETQTQSFQILPDHNTI